jgi:hypothetical protein
LVTITGSAKVGEATTLAQQLMVNMSSAALTFSEPAAGIPAAVSPLLPVVVTDCQKVAKDIMISNALGYSTPFNTAVSVTSDTATGVGGDIPSGKVVVDNSSFGASFFSLVIDPSLANNPPCSNQGLASVVGRLELKAIAPLSLRQTVQRLNVTYPSGALSLVAEGTDNSAVVLSMTGCGFEKRQFEVIGTDGVTLPAGSSFAVDVESEASAVLSVTTVDPGLVLDPSADAVPLSKLLAAPSINPTSRQLVYLRIRAPSGGASPCSTAAPQASATFNIRLTITSGSNGQRSTKTLSVKYPILKV